MSFPKRVLDGLAAHACESRDVLQGERASPLPRHLDSDDGQDRLLGQREPRRELRRQAPMGIGCDGLSVSQACYTICHAPARGTLDGLRANAA